jgi:hypothetical protein
MNQAASPWKAQRCTTRTRTNAAKVDFAGRSSKPQQESLKFLTAVIHRQVAEDFGSEPAPDIQAGIVDIVVVRSEAHTALRLQVE